MVDRLIDYRIVNSSKNRSAGRRNNKTAVESDDTTQRQFMLGASRLPCLSGQMAEKSDGYGATWSLEP
jgi:hypothetical protein